MEREGSIENVSELLLYIDGASRGNPGRAGAGVLIKNPSGERMAEVSRYLGYRTNNEAEYEALLLGLKEAKRLRRECLRIYTDSELIEKQVKGEYRVKEAHLKRLHQKALKLLREFPRVEIEAIPREKNKEADLLANRAIERRLLREKKEGGSRRGRMIAPQHPKVG